MDHEREIIEQQMAETRHALTDKLGQLEQSVANTVSDAAETVEHVREAVTGTVQTVTDSVRDTVESVTDALDVTKQVQRHPWGMVAGAAAVGFVGGCLLYTQTPRREEYSEPARPTGDKPAKNGNGKHESSRPSLAKIAQQSLLGSGASWGPVVDKLRGLAVGTALGLVKDLVIRSVPPTMEKDVHDVVDGITTALGGRPISGHVLPDKREEYRRQMADGAPASAAESWERASRF